MTTTSLTVNAGKTTECVFDPSPQDRLTTVLLPLVVILASIPAFYLRTDQEPFHSLRYVLFATHSN